MARWRRDSARSIEARCTGSASLAAQTEVLWRPPEWPAATRLGKLAPAAFNNVCPMSPLGDASDGQPSTPCFSEPLGLGLGGGEATAAAGLALRQAAHAMSLHQPRWLGASSQRGPGWDLPAHL